MINNEIIPALRAVHCEYFHHIYWLQYGARANTANLKKIIGSNQSQNSRYSVLHRKPCDYFLWGDVKNKVSLELEDDLN